MTTEEADLLGFLSAEKGGAIALSDLSKRARAIAGRLEANTNYLRIVAACACITKPGHAALQKHRAAFGKSEKCPLTSKASTPSLTTSLEAGGSS